jgi:hypothetical protein
VLALLLVIPHHPVIDGIRENGGIFDALSFHHSIRRICKDRYSEDPWSG